MDNSALAGEIILTAPRAPRAAPRRQPPIIDVYPGFDAVRAGAHRAALPPEAKRARGPSAPWRFSFLWLVLIAAALGAVAAVLLSQNPAPAPSAASSPTLVASPAPLANVVTISEQPSFSFGDLGTVRIFARGQSAIMLSGELSNSGRTAGELPMIRIETRDATGTVLSARDFVPPTSILGANSGSRFMFDLAAVPPGAHDIRIVLGTLAEAIVPIR